MEAILREKEREDKLQSAKKKASMTLTASAIIAIPTNIVGLQQLKSYRARQTKATAVSASPAKRNSISKSSVLGGPASPSRAEFMAKHLHRRSASRASASFVMPKSQSSSSLGSSTGPSEPFFAAGQHTVTVSPSPSHARRNSSRHSRTISISISSVAPYPQLAMSDPSLISSGLESSNLSFTRSFPTSSSSPQLSAFAGFSFQPMPSSSPSSNAKLQRQSVPHFTTAANGRILSPQSSPLLAQSQNSQNQPPPPQFSPFRRSSLQMLKSPSSLEQQQQQQSPMQTPNTHARRPSKHTRRNSVATRRESMEIMAGISFGGLAFPGSSSPDPNASATGAFLASAEMSRSSTLQSSSSERDGSTLLLASLSMEDRQLSETEERTMALQTLEGRLTAETEAIELPAEDSTAAAAIAAATNASSKVDKRASWNGNPLANVGGKGATDLGMLIEEEEEEDNEGHGREKSQPSPSKSSKLSPYRAPPLSASNALRKQRPSSLIFPPSRSLPFGANHGNSARSQARNSDPVSPTESIPPLQKSGFKGLSLASSVSSPNLSDNKALRRLSGLRSLTLASPEHGNVPASVVSPVGPTTASVIGPAGRKRLSLVSASPASTILSGIRPFSISSASSILKDRDGVVSPDGTRVFQLGTGSSGARIRAINNSTSSTASGGLSSSTGPGNSSMNASSLAGTPARSSRASLTYKSTPSPASAIGTSFSAATSPNTFSKRYSEASFASSASAFGFGDLVMEESLVEEEECSMQENEDMFKEDVEKTEMLGSFKIERPPLSRSNSSNGPMSEDPVILSMQVQALRSQIEHLRSESSTLHNQLAAVEETRQSQVDRLRDELSELRENSTEMEMERDMLREDIDGWRTRCSDLERTLQNERLRAEDERKEGLLLREKVRKLGDRLAATQSSQSDPASEDQALAIAQAKLIGEMRDQIFTLAASLERERLKNTHGDDTSRSTSPLLTALASHDSHDEDVSSSGRYNGYAAGSNGSISYNNLSMSSGTDSICSRNDNTSEETSMADDESVFGLGNKSPSSPFNNYSIHPNNMPSKSVDSSVNIGGLQTLTEEDEQLEEVEEEEEDGSRMSGDEDADQLPDLVPDESRYRTQSASTGSTDTNDPMPMTPVKASPIMQQTKPLHHRSDSFIKQWSFPKGPVEQMEEEDSSDRFWSIRHDSLPPLPVSMNVLEMPFSTEIALDEDFFSAGFGKSVNGALSDAPNPMMAQSGPPPSRSSFQAQRLSIEVEAVSANVASGVSSRLSWMWGSYLKGAPAALLPASIVSAAPLANISTQQTLYEEASPFSSISSSSSASSAARAPPPVPPKPLPAGRTGFFQTPQSKRPFKLQSSPLSQLDFTGSCNCVHSSSRILNL